MMCVRTYVRIYVSVTLRNVVVTSRRNVAVTSRRNVAVTSRRNVAVTSRRNVVSMMQIRAPSIYNNIIDKALNIAQYSMLCPWEILACII